MYTLKKNKKHSPIPICRYIQKLSLESAKISNIYSLSLEQKKKVFRTFSICKGQKKRGENTKSSYGFTNQIDFQIATQWRLK